jgi:hypothetical protein
MKEDIVDKINEAFLENLLLDNEKLKLEIEYLKLKIRYEMY